MTEHKYISESCEGENEDEISKWIDCNPRLKRYKYKIIESLKESDIMMLDDFLDYSEILLDKFCTENEFRSQLQIQFTKAVRKYQEDHQSHNANNSNSNHNNSEQKYENYNDEDTDTTEEIKINDNDSENVRKLKQELTRMKINKKNAHVILCGKSVQLFSCKDDKQIGVDEKILRLLRNNIPIVTVMGPSRQGKSTLVNGLLGKYACDVSHSCDQALTSGAWICYYEGKDKNSSFYLIDTEGLSHQVTTATRRLFYACYAISNVIIWSDRTVNADNFQNNMLELGTEMQAVAQSDQKPSFVLLKRDAKKPKPGVYGNLKTLASYVRKIDGTFKYLHDSNIFANLTGYELARPANDDEDTFTEQQMHKVRDFIVRKCSTSTRFVTDLQNGLSKQIEQINTGTHLSLCVKLITDHQVFKYFYYGDPQYSETAQYKTKKLVAMTEFAIANEWNANSISQDFNAAFNKKFSVWHEDGFVDDQMKDILHKNMNELLERVENKINRNVRTFGEDFKTRIVESSIWKKIKNPVSIIGLPFLAVATLVLVAMEESKYELGPTNEEKGESAVVKTWKKIQTQLGLK